MYIILGSCNRFLVLALPTCFSIKIVKEVIALQRTPHTFPHRCQTAGAKVFASVMNEWVGLKAAGQAFVSIVPVKQKQHELAD